MNLKRRNTQQRYRAAMRDQAFETIRSRPILETHPEHFLRVLERGTVSTNVFLRRIHNFALDMNWLPWPVLPKRRWPAPSYKEKRAITPEEQLARFQDRVNWLNRFVAQCDCNRPTLSAIEAEGFTISRLEQREMPKAPNFVRPVIVGAAVS